MHRSLIRCALEQDGKKEDLGKVQVMVESTYGDSHPGSGHLNILVEEVRKGIAEEGGFGARYNCTDICDGESQGTDGINYSLASREMIANMIASTTVIPIVHALTFRILIFLAIAVPAFLMSDIPVFQLLSSVRFLPYISLAIFIGCITMPKELPALLKAWQLAHSRQIFSPLLLKH